MKVTLKTWDRDRADSVILFVLLTLFFGYATVVIFGAGLSGDGVFHNWPYLLSPLITAVFAWALYVTVSPKYQYCMDAVKGTRAFLRLRR